MSENQVSEELPKIFEEILKKYEIISVFYAKGPGSFMAIKLSYIMLKTLSIVKNIPFFAKDGFYFNQNSAIKANANLFFVKENGKITLKKNQNINHEFKLPQILDENHFSSDTSPLYVLPAI